VDFLVEEIDQSTLSRKKTVFYHTRAQHFRKTALYFSRGNAQIDLQPQKRTNFPLKRLAFSYRALHFLQKSFQIPNPKIPIQTSLHFHKKALHFGKRNLHFSRGNARIKSQS